MNNQKSFNPADQSSTVWGAMFARSGNAADRLRDMAQQAIDQYNAELSGGGEPTYPAWAQDVFDVLAASRAMLPVTDSQLSEIRDRCAINADLWAESQAQTPTREQVNAVFMREVLAAPASPVAGWVSVETAPKDGTQILLTNGVDVAQGWWEHEAPSIEEIRDIDGRYIDQIENDGYDGWLDCEGGMQPDPTHWMPLPLPPAPVTPKQE